jgi:hypothetical protein
MLLLFAPQIAPILPGLIDLVSFTTPTTGTALALSVGASVDGGLTPNGAGATDNTEYPYGIVDADGTLREVGRGVVSAGGTVFTRTFEKSTTGAILSLSGSAKVFFTALAADFSGIPGGGDPSGTAATLLAAHVAASDPHTQYLTAAEGNAAYATVPVVITRAASNVEAATTGEIVILASNAAGLTITLPTAVGTTARYTVKKILASGVVTVACNGAQTIDDGATAVLASQYEAITLVSDNLNWSII